MRKDESTRGDGEAEIGLGEKKKRNCLYLQRRDGADRSAEAAQRRRRKTEERGSRSGRG